MSELACEPHRGETVRPHLSTGTLMMPKHSLLARRARHVTAFLAVSLLTVAACSDSGGGSAGGTSVVEVEIHTLPNNQTLANLVPGTTRQMLGVPINSSDNWVDKPVTWVSSVAAVATVSATGLVTAVAGGTTYIRATAGGRTDSVAVAVRFPVGSIAIAPATITLNREGAQALTLTVLDTQGAPVTGRTITYSSSDVTVATVSAAGVVQASATTADGTTTTITATAANASDGGTIVTATRLVTVTGDPVVASILITGGIAGSGFRGNTGTQQLTGSPRSALNNVVPGITITWATNAAGIATVSASGLVTFAGDTGSVTITATAAGAGAGGADVTATQVFSVGATLVSGVAFAVDLASNQNRTVAIYATGLDSFTVNVPGTGTGDLDWAMVAPTVSGWSRTIASLTNYLQPPGNWTSGNAGTVSRSKAQIVNGWYLINLYAWTGGGYTVPVAGETIMLIAYPTP